MPPNALSPWIMLPCIALSLLTTCLLVRALPTSSSGGLFTVTKAAITFLIILVLTSAAAKKHFCSTPEANPDSPKNTASRTIGKSNIRTFNRVNAWRDDVDGAMGDPNWFIPMRGAVWVDEKTRTKKRNKEREERRKEQRVLKDKFLLKRTGLLGREKEMVVEVVRED